MILCLFFFFFQAEDGIRDYKVTGVQTCALPISAFSPEANLVFVNSIDWCSTVKLDTKAPVFEAGKPFLGSANAFGDKDERKKGWITAVDADTGVVRWRRETSQPIVAGIAVTASGLVFTAGVVRGITPLRAPHRKLHPSA